MRAAPHETHRPVDAGARARPVRHHQPALAAHPLDGVDRGVLVPPAHVLHVERVHVVRAEPREALRDVVRHLLPVREVLHAHGDEDPPPRPRVGAEDAQPVQVIADGRVVHRVREEVVDASRVRLGHHVRTLPGLPIAAERERAHGLARDRAQLGMRRHAVLRDARLNRRPGTRRRGCDRTARFPRERRRGRPVVPRVDVRRQQGHQHGRGAGSRASSLRARRLRVPSARGMARPRARCREKAVVGATRLPDTAGGVGGVVARAFPRARRPRDTARVRETRRHHRLGPEASYAATASVRATRLWRQRC